MEWAQFCTEIITTFCYHLLSFIQFYFLFSFQILLEVFHEMQPELLKECWKPQRYATFSGKYIYKYFYVEKQFEELGNFHFLK